MDKLKQYIDSKREEFDQTELPEGHLERFEKKLPGHRKDKVIKFSLISLVAAASVALLVLFTVQERLPEEDARFNSHQVCESREEFEEVRFFYQMQINDILSRMEKLNEEIEIPEGDDLLEASHHVLSGNKRFEKMVLPSLPCSNDGLFAVNQHYKNSVESLHILLKHMEDSAERVITKQKEIQP